MNETLDERLSRLAHVISYGSHERTKRIIGEIIEEERAKACRIINEYSNNTSDMTVAQMAHDLIIAIARPETEQGSA
jgi:MFS superfamily sulfate permease-like transporter